MCVLFYFSLYIYCTFACLLACSSVDCVHISRKKNEIMTDFRYMKISLKLEDRVDDNDIVDFRVPESCRVGGIKVCNTSRPNFDQNIGLSFYNSPKVPISLDCIIVPPTEYRFPPKIPMPAVHFPNMYVNSFESLRNYNGVHNKNHYHFDSNYYDSLFLEHIRFGAQYIPFDTKVRNALDLGAGGGSLGLLLQQKYSINTISVIFPDWPYCEYISERGGLCLTLDVRNPMPFAKHSFDLIHMSWLLHSFDPTLTRKILLEINRMIRPGGYFWTNDGTSLEIFQLYNRTLSELGYKVLFLFEKNMQSASKAFFGNNPYEISFHALYLKPSLAIGRVCK